MDVIKTYLFLKPYQRKKDGLKQVMIRVKLGSKRMGKTYHEKTIDIQLLSESGEKYHLNEQQFANRKNENGLMGRFYEIIGLINKGVFLLNKEGFDINTKTLFNYVYAKPTSIKDSEHEELIDNDEVRKFFDHPVPVKVWESFISQTYLDEMTGQPVLEEELEDIASNIESDFYADKNQKEIEKLDFNERYQKGYYNKNNIFECFGFCWSNDKKNNEPLIANSYRGLLLRLHDYRFNADPPEYINSFDDEWIDKFLKFLVQEGYSTFQPRYYHPFNFDQYRIKFIEADRKPYRYAGFEKLVKHLKRYIFFLQKYKIIPFNRHPDLIEAKDYIGRKIQTTPYTRREHALTTDEFNLLATTDFADEKLNLARDMFIIAVLGGGFRGEELFNHELKLEKRGVKYLLHIFHSKTSSANINPTFGALNDVIKRHNGKLPEFMPREEFRKTLKDIAKELDFNRIIISPNTYLNAKGKQEKFVLKDIFSIYFARKTMVTMLSSYGVPDEKIIEFTSHAKTDTLLHYKSKTTIDEKEKIVKSFLENP